ncbi:DUF397 domain-containing protein [Streptomyces sp. WMMB 322]|uniref:DUF397 domain-containing protein n=1 Tax=Streptomyces sp. WMMB 322 TaxID=1286821 RepID=UPI0006E12E5D|nr:DUF397 domain-containing protein [Streptomyces sp. WMMB 322]SCK19444.1 protein of unknown function [Streptomyces sp. WMMB 322]
MTLQPTAPDTANLAWIKSSYSGSDDNDCVEAAAATASVHVRDSKNAHGPRLTFPAGAWSEFVSFAAPR